MATTSVLERLISAHQHAADVARTPAILKQWEGIALIIGRKMDMERKYIGRLEGVRGTKSIILEGGRRGGQGMYVELFACLGGKGRK